jgi:hypothetical protein
MSLHRVCQTAYNKIFRVRQVIFRVYFHAYNRICVGQTRDGGGSTVQWSIWLVAEKVWGHNESAGSLFLFSKGEFTADPCLLISPHSEVRSAFTDDTPGGLKTSLLEIFVTRNYFLRSCTQTPNQVFIVRIPDSVIDASLVCVDCK